MDSGPSDRLEGLIQVPDEVVGIFYSNAQPNKAFRNPRAKSILGADIAVSHRSRMLG
jgi:hypothetical protein